MPDVSIAISAQDNFSTAIARMQNATRSFSKDAEGLDRKMTALNRNKATLSVDVRNASKNLVQYLYKKHPHLYLMRTLSNLNTCLLLLIYHF